MSEKGQSCSSRMIPLWDLLPCNSYLISLLPIEDALRFVPSSGGMLLSNSNKTEFHDFLRFLAAAWLLSIQQRGDGGNGDLSAGRRSSLTEVIAGRSSGERRKRWLFLFALFAMDWAPTIYRFVAKQMEPFQMTYWSPFLPSTPLLMSSQDNPSRLQERPRRQSQLAAQRRNQLWKILQSAWPLVRLALWMQLVVTHDVDGKSTSSSSSSSSSSSQNGRHAAARTKTTTALLYTLYAHRRWLHEQGMELWPTVIRPLLESSRDTQRWVLQQWRKNLVRDVHEDRR